ncbi:ATP-binding cassette domain-containing protein, partial [Burkholderia multivorans]|uniref:ATP-binding cassette domain-containing protein n=1 Tax=Burkholderia multivorans TaxID=87883 RepID=UPI000DB5780A
MKPSPSGLVLPEQRVVAVDDLSVMFRRERATFDAVRHVSFHVDRGETLAIVGESGSRGGAVVDLVQASAATMRGIRGADVAMIFQEPMTSLNPVFTVGDQISEAIALHQAKSPAQARAEALRLLDLVRIPEARRVFARYPHQLSGGMRQRVMI